ncbi:RHS repeat-associated core domain-containing protein, partial [Bacteroides thetaiotaomicron]|uniref:RHS repeat-associated core domain-containing protein n=2 Tax=Bacteroides TaxID=816 RepID=UPI0039C18B24
TPVAKVTDRERYTIVHDYLGTPTQAYDSKGELVWEMLLDVYGEVAECHGDRTLVPFRYQGQYEDEETGLYYNRFRYYSSQMGMYISSDPIGLAGNNPTLYGYVQDVNVWIDPWGLNIKRIYEKAPYHGRKDNSVKSRAPIDGQGALDNSIQVKSTNPRRVGIDPTNNEFVILDRTRITNDGTEIYHGHVRSWEDMTVEQQNALIKNNRVDRKGKIKCKN